MSYTNFQAWLINRSNQNDLQKRVKRSEGPDGFFLETETSSLLANNGVLSEISACREVLVGFNKNMVWDISY
jgi:hypothetical protein